MAEIKESKNVWLLAASGMVLLAAFWLQFHVDFGQMLERWDSQDFSYCYLVPFIFLYLIYLKKEELKTYEVRPSLSGFLVLFLSGLLYLGGRLGSIETLTSLSIWLAIIGLGLLLLGTRIIRALAFPLVILAFIVPVPPFLNQTLTFQLKLISSALSVNMMQAVGLSVFGEGNIIDIGITQLQVVDACSGLRYVYPLLLMGVLFAYLFHKRWWERVIIILATVPISVFSNALRIAITGYLGKNVSQEAADGFFHGFSGWVIFMVSLVFLVVLSGILKMVSSRWNNKTMPSHQGKDSSTPSFDLKNIKQSYLWGGVFSLLFFWGTHSTLASNQIIPDRTTFKEFPTEIGDWKGEKTYLREEILNSLWADDYVQIQYQHFNTGDVLLLFVPYYEFQENRHTAHAPLSCLVGGGFAPLSREILERDLPEPFGRVKIRQMVLEKDGELLLSNYWFQQRGSFIVSEYANKWFLFWDSITKRRTDGALVRLEMPLRHKRDVERAQEMMDAFTMELMEILPEYVRD